MIFRQHWMILTYKIFVWLLFVAILLVSDFLFKKYLPQIFIQPYLDYYQLAKSVYFMLLILGLLIIWVMYYLNVYIITSRRIVDIDQVSLLKRTVSELHLSRIEDVTAEISGVFGTFLDYGNVYVQTAGETERFEFEKVPDPARIEKIILDLYEKLPQEDKKHALEAK